MADRICVSQSPDPSEPDLTMLIDSITFLKQPSDDTLPGANHENDRL